MKNLPDKKPTSGSWIQTERAAHEAWAELMRKHPNAARLMHLLVARVGEHNAVVVSQNTLAKMLKVSSRNTVISAVKALQKDNWIEVRRIGGSGTTNAYIINDRVAWTGKRDGIRYSLFSASVVIADDEQPDSDRIDSQEPLRRLPKVGEIQIPSGAGLEPPSQPSLPEMETELPSADSDQIDLETYLQDQR